MLDKLRADGVVPIVEAVTAAGALVGALDDYSITSGRVVTGTNPESGRSATERRVLADYPSLSVEEAIEILREFGGL